MIIENCEALKKWLTACLGRMCDADPDALAKYIIALVKKNKTENELREFCLDQLEVFLLKDTKAFVDLLFQALEKKSYLINEISSPTKEGASYNSNMPPKILPLSSLQTDNSSLNAETENKSTNSRSIPPASTGLLFSKPNTEKEIEHKRPATFSDDATKKDFVPSKKQKVKHSPPTAGLNLDENKDEKAKTCKFAKESKEKGEICVGKESEKKEDKSVEPRKNIFPVHKSVSRSKSPNSSPKKSDSHAQNSRGYSYSHSSRSRSREHADLRINLNQRLGVKAELDKKLSERDHGDTDYRERQVSLNSQAENPNNCSSKKRCKDYDERGYCMRGDMCIFDHGTDPLVVEDVSVLNFGVPVSEGSQKGRSKSPLQQPPPPPPPPPSTPPPPPPPLPPAPTGYIAEPYNPEAPRICLADQVNYYMTSGHLLMPSSHHSPGPPAVSNISQSVLFNEPPPYISSQNVKQQRARELIGVPIDTDSCLEKSTPNESPHEKDSSHVESLMKSRMCGTVCATVGENGKSKFDYSRLGMTPTLNKIKIGRVSNRSTLEVRKIPAEKNTIAMLNSHFSKFGTVVNLMVGYDGDPEAALVQFLTHAEATAAYRSTDAVFNNRFVKVFWHNQNRINESNINCLIPPKEEEKLASSTFFVSSSEGTPENMETKTDLSNQTDVKHNIDKIRSIIPSPLTKENFSRTVFNPASMKKNNLSTFSATHSPHTSERASHSPRQKEVLCSLKNKKLELHKKKNEFLKLSINHQKVILDKLRKCKNVKQKEFLKETIQNLTTKISSLEKDVKKDASELKNLFKPVNLTTKTEAEKDLLDAEMDLYKQERKTIKGDEKETANLLTKVHELKQKAKALGLIDNSSSHGEIGMGLAKKPISRYNLSRHLSRSVDHRPRKIMVSGFCSSDKEDLLKHFMKFGKIENFEQFGNDIGVTFCSRIAAEAAFSMGSKFRDTMLSLTWSHDSQISAVENPEIKNDVNETKSEERVAADDDEDEDEASSEARSWRR